jgi:glutathione synthase/RimK-type ligase-like ATP-grasp enzyme
MKDISLKKEITGPLVGILTARKKDGMISGNGPLFIALQKKLISHDGISFIFTVEDVGVNSIVGYMFHPEKKSWLRKSFPFPDLVYNRIPFRNTEQQESCQQFFSLLSQKKIPFFNPCFINKHHLYSLFGNHPVLREYLPETILVTQKQALYSFIQKHNKIYLKPAKSARGKGVYRLEINESDENEVQISLKGVKEHEWFDSFHQFWLEWEKELKEKTYLAQKSIQPALYNGNRFDFRIIAHADEQSRYIVTGVGIRQSQKQDVTTHIPAGGEILPYKDIQSPEHDEFIETIVQHVGEALTNQFGFFGEFSIDAGQSQTGQYYLFEVNSKPMSFDEPHIEERKTDHLCRLFLQLIKKNKNQLDCPENIP